MTRFQQLRVFRNLRRLVIRLPDARSHERINVIADLDEVALAFGFALQTLRVWKFDRVKHVGQLLDRLSPDELYKSDSKD